MRVDGLIQNMTKVLCFVTLFCIYKSFSWHMKAEFPNLVDDTVTNDG